MLNDFFEERLEFKYPIFWNDASITRDFAEILVHKIIASRPKKIVDIGGGLSTIICAKITKKLGLKTKIISIDSDKRFFVETKNRLIAEDLLDDNIIFLEAPIVDVKVNGQGVFWYSIKKDKLFKDTDLLIVDGPLGTLCKNSRYPALPFFNEYLTDGSSILLDDTNRPDEQEIIKLWLDQFGLDEIQRRKDYERGIAELIFRR